MSRPTSPPFRAWRADAIGAVICLAMCAGTYLASIRPLIARHDRFAQERQQLATQREKAAEAAQLLVALKKDLAAARSRINATPLKLQPAQQMNRRLAQLSALADDAGADVDDLQPGHVTVGTRYDTCPIHFAGSGTYTSFTLLLHRIRVTFPDTGVTTLEIIGRPTDPTGQTKFKFDLIWYTSPAPRGVAALETSK